MDKALISSILVAFPVFCSHAINISRLQSSTRSLYSISIVFSVACFNPKFTPRLNHLTIGLRDTINKDKWKSANRIQINYL